MSIDIFDTRTMLDAVEQMYRPTNFLRDTFFPADTPSDTETLDIDVIKGNRKIAPFCSPLAEGKVVPRSGFTVSTIKPGYIKVKRPTSAGDLLTRLPGSTIYAKDQSVEQRAAILLGRDMAELMDEIDRREEWIAASALDTGAVTITMKGDTADSTYSVDFGMLNTHKVTLTGSDLWSHADSNPLALLASKASVIRQDSGISPNKLILGSDAAAAFIAKYATATGSQAFDMRAVDLGEIKPAELGNGVGYLGRIRYSGLFVDVYTYDAWYADETSGTLTPLVPAKKAWLCSSNTANRTQYAVIQDIEAIDGGQAAVSRFPKSWVTKDPAVRWLMIQSAPMPTLKQPDAFMSITVLS